MRTAQALSLTLVSVLSAFIVGCGNDSAPISILPDNNVFYQNSSDSVNNKIDVLWVVDNSGSMETSQTNLATNFPVFIQNFVAKNLDFQMAVTTTDAFVALPTMSPIYSPYRNSIFQGIPQAQLAKFRDGAWSNHSGVFVMNPDTPDLLNVFSTNITQGIDGWGDERPFQSLETALSSSYNSGFVRSNSFLAVIIITDEDDFSNPTINYLEDEYSNPDLISTDYYVSYLDGLTNSVPGRRYYSVNSITIEDAPCLTQLTNPTFSGRKIATRVMDLVDKTGGRKTSLCGDFGEQMSLVADSILELSTQFYLDRIPVVSSIEVKIDGNSVPEAATNPGPSVGGWTYDANANSIIFSGDYIPEQGAQIIVNFDPTTLK